MMDRRAETKAVKAALTKAGYTGVRVKHGNGSAWGWLDVFADGLSHSDQRAREVIQAASGRSKYGMENLILQATGRGY